MNNSQYLPEQVRIGSKVYTIIPQTTKWHEDTEAYGSFDRERGEINIVTENVALGEILDTLLHETLHVVWAEWNLPSRPREERAVTSLGTGLAAVFAQNVEYARAVAALAEAINDE